MLVRFHLLPILLLACAIPAHGITLDWDTSTWTAGSLSQSYDIDPSNPGNDITVTFSNDTSALTNDPTTGIQTPAIDKTMEGGQSPVQKSLDIAANLGTTTKIIVTVTFSAGYVNGIDGGLSFSIFDIDHQTNNDRVSAISATSLGGASIAPVISNVGSSVVLSGSGVNQLLDGKFASSQTGVNSGNGNATISFGQSQQISSFTFTFNNNNGAPKLQQIAISDINFTPVPEVNPAWFGASAFFLAAGWTLWARRRKADSRQSETDCAAQAEACESQPPTA